jgi:hypothetical protein
MPCKSARLKGVYMFKKGIALLFAIFFSMTIGCVKKAEEMRIISIIVSVGDVKIVSQKKEHSTNPGTVLNNGDEIITGNKSFIDLNFLDKGVIRIGENSSVNIDILTADAMKESAKMSMQKGKMVITLSRLRKDSSFEVRTSTSVAAVRGTTLKVVSDESGSKVYVVKGKVSVAPISDGTVVNSAEKVVEENYAVALAKQEVQEIAEKKKEIQAVEITKTEIEAIKDELKEVSKAPIQNEEMTIEARQIVEENQQPKKEPEKKSAPRQQKKSEPVTSSTTEKKAEAVSGPGAQKKNTIPIAPNL